MRLFAELSVMGINASFMEGRARHSDDDGKQATAVYAMARDISYQVTTYVCM